MKLYCSNCGKPLTDGAKFCIGCGKPAAAAASQTPAATDRNPAAANQSPAAKVDKKSASVKTEKGGFWRSLVNEAKELFTHPKKLIPTFVLSGVWILFSILSTVGVNIPFFRFLYTLTYSNGGMFGGFFGAVGGIFGKAVFAAVINIIVLDLCAKKNPFKGLKSGFVGIFKGGLSAIFPFIIGGGIGLLLYSFFNITSSPVNCAVAVVGAVGAVSAVAKKNGLLCSAVFCVLKKLSKGRAPSQTAVMRVVSGISAGFAVGLPLTFARLAWLNFVLALLMIVVPIIVSIILNNKGTKTPAAKAASFIALLLMLSLTVSGLLPAFAAKYDDSYAQRSFKDESLWMSDLSKNSFYGQKYDSENGVYLYDWVHQVWDEDHKQLYFQEKFDMTVTMKPVVKNIGEWLDSMSYHISVAAYSTDYLLTNYKTVDDIPTPEGYSRMAVKVSGYDAVYIYETHRSEGNGNGITSSATNEGRIYVPITGAPTYEGKTNTLVINCSLGGESFELYDTMLDEYLNLLKNLPCKINIEHKVKEFKKGSASDFASENTSSGSSSADGSESDSDLKPYRGRLTYTNGRKNKYGQPFPDLMDFDGDGEITWLDVSIQSELSHDPDWLDRPVSKGVGIMLAILTGLLGAAGGAVGGAIGGIAGSAGGFAASSAASGIAEAAAETAGGISGGTPDYDDAEEKKEEDLGPYVSRDADGDLCVKDPATGEERLYVANGDGTYTNPLTGATYTESELKDSLESREENADLIRQDEAVAKAAIEDQRDENAEKSWVAEEYEAEKAAQLEKEKQEQIHNEYVEKLAEKYDIHSGEEALREKIGREQGEAEIEGYEQFEYEKEYEKSQKYAENVKKSADTAIDVLAEIEPTGAGKVIKDKYTVGVAIASNAGDAMAGYKSVGSAIAQAGVDAAVGLAKNHAGDVNLTGTAGYAEKAAANIMGDGIAATTNELAKGKSLEKAKAAGSNAAKQGAVNFAVDSTFDALGAKFGSDSGDTAVKILGDNVTKKGLTEGSKALGSDIVKDTLSPDDPDEVAAEKAVAAREAAEAEANREAAERFKKAQEEWAKRKNDE